MTAAVDQPSVEERQGYIGGSDVSSILSLSPFGGSPFKVFAQKMGVEVPRFDSPELQEKFEWGHAMEPVIAKLFSKRYSIPVRRTKESFYRNKAHPCMGAHLDFEVADDSRAIVECKNIEYLSDEWGEPSASLTDEASARVPLYYLTQVDHYLCVRDAPYAYLLALVGGCRLRFYFIKRSAAREACIVQACEQFWKRVEQDLPPPFAGPDDLLAAIQSGYLASFNASRAKEAKAFLQLGAAEQIAIKEVVSHRAAKRRAETLESAARLALLELLKGRTGYLFAGKNKLGSFLVGERENFDEFSFKLAHPEVHAQYMRKALTGPVLRLRSDKESKNGKDGREEKETASPF